MYSHYISLHSFVFIQSNTQSPWCLLLLIRMWSTLIQCQMKLEGVMWMIARVTASACAMLLYR